MEKQLIKSHETQWVSYVKINEAVKLAKENNDRFIIILAKEDNCTTLVQLDLLNGHTKKIEIKEK